MIDIIPAIDIIDGQCVRLTRGDYTTRQQYGDALSVARRYEELGFHRLHLVDLDGAREGHPVNLHTIATICSQTHLTVDCGGGLRTTDHLQCLFDTGAQMASVGSVAITCPALFAEWMDSFGADRLILCADIRDGHVSLNGWQDTSSTPLTDLLAQYISLGVRHVLITDIARDGTLTGPSVALYAKVVETYPSMQLIASGGVSSMADIDALEHAHVPAVVVGKAIYEGKIDIKTLRERCLPRE